MSLMEREATPEVLDKLVSLVFLITLPSGVTMEFFSLSIVIFFTCIISLCAYLSQSPPYSRCCRFGQQMKQLWNKLVPWFV